MFEPVNFAPEAIASIVGVVLALIFAYFPKLRTWYAALASEVKSYIMLGLLLVAEIAIALLSYYGVIPTTEPITLAKCISIALALLISNQPTYLILPEAGDVKALRLTRDIKLLK